MAALSGGRLAPLLTALRDEIVADGEVTTERVAAVALATTKVALMLLDACAADSSSRLATRQIADYIIGHATTAREATHGHLAMLDKATDALRAAGIAVSQVGDTEIMVQDGKVSIFDEGRRVFWTPRRREDGEHYLYHPGCTRDRGEVVITLTEWLARFPERAAMSLQNALHEEMPGIYFDDKGGNREFLPGSLLTVIDGNEGWPHPFQVEVYAPKKVTPEWAREAAQSILDEYTGARGTLSHDGLLRAARDEYAVAWYETFGDGADDDDGADLDELRALFVAGVPTVEALADLVTLWVGRSDVYVCEPTGEIIVVTEEDVARIWPKEAIREEER
jgi:hypothetical protein